MQLYTFQQKDKVMARLTFDERNKNNYTKYSDVSIKTINKYKGLLPEELRNAGQWYATMPAFELRELLEKNPKLKKDWEEPYGDRMQKLVFIGQNMDKEAIKAELDKCLK